MAEPSYHKAIPQTRSPLDSYNGRKLVSLRWAITLTDNTTYQAHAEYADYACYRASHNWTFTTDLGVPGPDDYDDTPPVISDLWPAPGSTVSGDVNVRALFSDPESGIDYRTVEVLLDGTHRLDYNTMNGYAFNTLTGRLYTFLFDVPPGPHTIAFRTSHYSNSPSTARTTEIQCPFTKL